jgi:hypothetical protein
MLVTEALSIAVVRVSKMVVVTSWSLLEMSPRAKAMRPSLSNAATGLSSTLMLFLITTSEPTTLPAGSKRCPRTRLKSGSSQLTKKPPSASAVTPASLWTPPWLATLTRKSALMGAPLAPITDPLMPKPEASPASSVHTTTKEPPASAATWGRNSATPLAAPGTKFAAVSGTPAGLKIRKRTSWSIGSPRNSLSSTATKLPLVSVASSTLSDASVSFKISNCGPTTPVLLTMRATTSEWPAPTCNW